MNVMEMSTRVTKRRCIHDELDDKNFCHASFSSSSSSSISCNGSRPLDVTISSPRQHQSPHKVQKILTIPPEWIYESLPTDKEYGRWIRSQLTTDQLINENKRKERQQKQDQHPSWNTVLITLNPEENPWKRLHQEVQNAIVNSIAKVTHKPHQHNKINNNDAEFFDIWNDEMEHTARSCIEMACYNRRDRLPKSMTF
jgi:hypothetical protein